MSLHTRIQQKLEEKRLKAADLAKATGKSAVAAGKWVHGTSVPTAENLKIIAHVLGVSDDWLLYGTGEMNQDKNNFTNVAFNESPLRKIPILDFVQAGIFNEVGYDGINPKGETYTTYQSCKPDSVFSLEVTGLSMSPEFAPGDKLVIDSAKDPYPGCYVIAQNGSHEATFKKYRAIGYDKHGRETFELVPLNPDFPIMNSTQQEIRIIGVVVEHLRSFRK